MPTCHEIADFLLAYTDGTLPRRQRLVFTLHVAMCRACRTYLRTYEETVALGKAAFTCDDETPPAGIPEELVEAILAARRASDEPAD